MFGDNITHLGRGLSPSCEAPTRANQLTITVEHVLDQ